MMSGLLGFKPFVSVKTTHLMSGFGAEHARAVVLLGLVGRREPEYGPLAVAWFCTHLYSKRSRRIAFGKAWERWVGLDCQYFQSDRASEYILMACDWHSG
jgi:hypothetical protein